MSFYRRLAATLRSGRGERELDAELQFHIDQRTEDLVAQGLTPVEARRQAALMFGHRATLREATRERDILGQHGDRRDVILSSVSLEC